MSSDGVVVFTHDESNDNELADIPKCAINVVFNSFGSLGRFAIVSLTSENKDETLKVQAILCNVCRLIVYCIK